MEDHASPPSLTFWTSLFAQFFNFCLSSSLIDKVIGLLPCLIQTFSSLALIKKISRGIPKFSQSHFSSSSISSKWPTPAYPCVGRKARLRPGRPVYAGGIPSVTSPCLLGMTALLGLCNSEPRCYAFLACTNVRLSLTFGQEPV